MALFTRETARLAGLKSVQVRRANAINAELNPPPQTPPIVQNAVLNDVSAYPTTRLGRVRKQLDLVDKRIKEAAEAEPIDGQSLNWLCAAQERLAEQERILAGRPLPGSRRPAPERSSRRQDDSGPGPVVPQ